MINKVITLLLIVVQLLYEKRSIKLNKGSNFGQKDIWGLRSESENSLELWLLISDLTCVSKTVQDISDALIYLSSIEQLNISGSKLSSYQLATQVQLATDNFMKAVQTNSAPIAPAYPVEWLSKRMMMSIIRFQENSTVTNGEVVVQPTKSLDHIEKWWKVAADGIKFWHGVRKPALGEESK